MVAVIVLLAVLGGVSAVSLRGWIRRRAMATAVQRVAAVDAAARRSAVRDGGGVLRIDPEGVAGGGRRRTWPRGIELAGVALWDAPDVGSGALELRLDDVGRGPSYRFWLRDADGRRQWAVVGVSGQVVEVAPPVNPTAGKSNRR